MTEVKQNVIDTFGVSTGGTVTDFGDMNFSRTKTAGNSNSHGGLSEGYQGTRVFLYVINRGTGSRMLQTF